MIRNTPSQEALYRLHGFPEAANTYGAGDDHLDEVSRQFGFESRTLHQRKGPHMFSELESLITIIEKKDSETAAPATLTTSSLVAEVAFCSISRDMIEQQSAQLEEAIRAISKDDQTDDAKMIRRAVAVLKVIPAMHKRCAAELDFRIPVPPDMKRP